MKGAVGHLSLRPLLDKHLNGPQISTITPKFSGLLELRGGDPPPTNSAPQCFFLSRLCLNFMNKAGKGFIYLFILNSFWRDSNKHPSKDLYIQEGKYKGGGGRICSSSSTEPKKKKKPTQKGLAAHPLVSFPSSARPPTLLKLPGDFRPAGLDARDSRTRATAAPFASRDPPRSWVPLSPPKQLTGITTTSLPASSATRPAVGAKKRRRSRTGYYSPLSGPAATDDGQLPASATDPIRFHGQSSRKLQARR